MFSGFSWEPVYLSIRLCMHARYCEVRLFRRICLPKSTSTPFNRLFRQPATVSLLRLHITHEASTGILTRSSIRYASRLPVRTRLTLIRLALIRKPWSFGEEVYNPLYRYLYLHLLFRKVQHGSSPVSSAPSECSPTDLTIPRLR